MNEVVRTLDDKKLLEEWRKAGAEIAKAFPNGRFP